MPSVQASISADMDGVQADVDARGDVLGGICTQLNASVNVDDLADIENSTVTVRASVNGVDMTVVSRQASELAAALGPLLGELPAANDVIAPLTETIGLVTELADLDLANSIQALGERLDTEFDSNSGYLQTAMSVAELMRAEPTLANLRSLLERLARLFGAEFNASDYQVSDLLPAFTELVPALRSMMVVHTILTDAEQLTRVMQSQLNAETLNNGFTFIEQQWGQLAAEPLANFLSGIDPSDSAQVEAARFALQSLFKRLQGLTVEMTQGMAFGEATLVHLNPQGLRNGLQEASQILRSANLDPTERVMQKLRDVVSPLFTLDFNALPAMALDDLLTQLEAQVGTIAADIAAFDTSALTDPLAEGIDAVAAIPQQLTDALQQVTQSLQTALEQVRSAVASIPVNTLVGAIRAILQPIQDLLAGIQALLQRIQTLLGEAAAQIDSLLGTAETELKSLRDFVQGKFDVVAKFIDDLPIERALGQVGDAIEELADLIAQADMSPYFDTVNSAIGTTADVVDKVPFALLPDSMEQDMVDAIRPVKTYDVDALLQQLRTVLQIDDATGEFTAKADIFAALSAVQAEYDNLLAEIKKHDPMELVAGISAELDNLKAEIEQLVPAVALQPLNDAVAEVRGLLDQAKPDEWLQPVYQAFDEAGEFLDQYNPATLIEPLDQQLDEARASVIELIKLDTWGGQLDELKAQTLKLLDFIDPAQIESELESFVTELQQQTDRLPQVHLGQALGSFFDAVVGGLGIQAKPSSFTVVLDWLQGKSIAIDGLNSASRAAADAMTATRVAVEAVDPSEIVGRIQPQLDAIKAVVRTIPDADVRQDLLAIAEQLDLNAMLGGVGANRQRYLGLLRDAEQVMLEVANTGVDEVQLGAQRVTVAFSPLAFIKELFNELLSRLGLDSVNLSLPALFRQLFEIATPARIAGVLEPIFTALKGRVEAVLDSVIVPLKNTIDTLESLINQFDLDPLKDSLNAIHAEVKAQFDQLHPRALLADLVGEFESLKTALDAPLFGAIEAMLTSMQDSATRVLDMLDLEELVAEPIAAYKRMLERLGQLDVVELLTPLIAQLDHIAAQVDSGLDDTTTQFRRLQDALPNQVGSISVSVSASVSA